MGFMEDFMKEVKAEAELNFFCMVELAREGIKTAIITWVPILIGIGIYNLLK